jgi:Uma2 family endonuclease
MAEALITPDEAYELKQDEDIDDFDGDFVEIINGVKCSKGVPTEEHQALVGEIYGQFRDYLEDKPCQPFIAPFALNAKDYGNIIPFEKDMYLPDVVVMCRNEDGKRNPTVVIEVASPSTVYYDLTIKLDIYERIGVKEYWVVIAYSYVIVHSDMDDGHMDKVYRTRGDILNIPVRAFPGLSVSLDKNKLYKVIDFKKD